MRAIRFALEYAKAELALRDWGIRSTIIVFGGARRETSWIIDRAGNPDHWGWLFINYRGFGLSEGYPSERAVVEAVRVAAFRTWTTEAIAVLRSRGKGSFSGLVISSAIASNS